MVAPCGRCRFAALAYPLGEQSVDIKGRAMRYSEYFVKVREIAGTDPQRAESLLREAESHASQAVPEHLVLCARGWEHDLHNHDNAVRCMLEAECRAYDCYMYLYLATAHLKFFGTVALAERCFRKAVALAKTDEDLARLREFFETFAPDMMERSQGALLELEKRICAKETRQIGQGDTVGNSNIS